MRFDFRRQITTVLGVSANGVMAVSTWNKKSGKIGLKKSATGTPKAPRLEKNASFDAFFSHRPCAKKKNYISHMFLVFM